MCSDEPCLGKRWWCRIYVNIVSSTSSCVRKNKEIAEKLYSCLLLLIQIRSQTDYPFVSTGSRATYVNHVIFAAGSQIQFSRYSKGLLVTSLPRAQGEWGEKGRCIELGTRLLSLPVTVKLLPTIVQVFLYLSYHDILSYVALRRALSQVCIDYQRVFLPLLWDPL